MYAYNGTEKRPPVCTCTRLRMGECSPRKNVHGREGSGGSAIIVRVTQTAFSGSSGLEEGGGGERKACWNAAYFC